MFATRNFSTRVLASMPRAIAWRKKRIAATMLFAKPIEINAHIEELPRHNMDHTLLTLQRTADA